jgi:hypothetical protein
MRSKRLCFSRSVNTVQKAVKRVCIPRRHHYIPVFYLKQWTGADGRLCEFSRPYDLVKPRMTRPRRTAYEYDLYKIQGTEHEFSQATELRFLKRVDQLAADALQILLHGSGHITEPLKSGWSRFIMSLLQRTPERIEWIGENVDLHYNQRLADIEVKYTELRKPSDPPTFADYMSSVDPVAREKAKAILLQKICDLPIVGQRINNMSWHVIEMNMVPYPLFTSDRPVVMTNGIAYPTSYIVIPLTPRHMFLAVNNVEMEAQLRIALDRGDLYEHINNMVVSQAHKYVYATDDTLLPFVEAHLRKRTPSGRRASPST